jgi:ABC-type branched-subunit amino acid transport system permease subunit
LSIEFLVAVVIGGAATVFGPLVGAWILVFTQNFIGSTLPRWSEQGFFEHLFGNRVSKRVLVNPAAAPAVFGILLILFVYVLPDGLVGGAKRFARRFGANASKTPPTPTPLDTSPRPPVTPVEA